MPSSKKESQIQREIIEYLEKEVGAYVVKVIRANKAGVADIIACVPYQNTTQDGITFGYFIAVEVKRKGNKPTKLQQHHLNLVKNSGGVAFVAYSVLDVELNLL